MRTIVLALSSISLISATLLCGSSTLAQEAESKEYVVPGPVPEAAQPPATPPETDMVEEELPPVGPPPQPQTPVEITTPSNQPTSSTTTETNCSDRRDDDGDALVDCADSDCFDAGVCEAGNVSENDEARCSDWIDNDGDGGIDCEDSDCGATYYCRGSHPPGKRTPQSDPKLSSSQSTEDLVAGEGDATGERNDYMCSDGVDNDGDGLVDCQDYGCKYDPSVRVCNNNSSFRFSVVASIGASVDFGAPAGQRGDINFTRLQVRALGSIPGIHNSFFLLSFRLEKTPRLTFAVFQVPLGKGHYINVNSGSGGLATALIISAAKNPLLEPAFYIAEAFERGNGAALELGGPITRNNKLRYRAFVAGGAGEFNGNVGGRFFRSDDRNFTYTVGAQLHINFSGFYDRFDTRMAYQGTGPLVLGATIGAKWDQRADERFPAGHAQVFFSWKRLLLQAETYMKYVLDFGSFQYSWNALATVVLIPKKLSIAADIGGFSASAFDVEPERGSNALPPENELRLRAALHYYWLGPTGIFSLLFDHRRVELTPGAPVTVQNVLRAEAQFRF